MIKIVILGAGESGAGAAVLAKKQGFDVFVSDMSKINDKYKKLMDDHQISWEEGQHSEEKILEADALVVGSPIYWHDTTGMFRNFIERLFFPILSYDNADEHGAIKYLDKRMPTAVVYTMNMPSEYYNVFNYHIILEPVRKQMEAFFGSCEQLEARNTWQFFPDYSKFDAKAVDVNQKQWIRDNQWPKDLQAAYELGRRMIEKD